MYKNAEIQLNNYQKAIKNQRTKKNSNQQLTKVSKKRQDVKLGISFFQNRKKQAYNYEKQIQRSKQKLKCYSLKRIKNLKKKINWQQEMIEVEINKRFQYKLIKDKNNMLSYQAAVYNNIFHCSPTLNTNLLRSNSSRHSRVKSNLNPPSYFVNQYNVPPNSTRQHFILSQLRKSANNLAQENKQNIKNQNYRLTFGGPSKVELFKQQDCNQVIQLGRKQSQNSLGHWQHNNQQKQLVEILSLKSTPLKKSTQKQIQIIPKINNQMKKKISLQTPRKQDIRISQSIVNIQYQFTCTDQSPNQKQNIVNQQIVVKNPSRRATVGEINNLNSSNKKNHQSQFRKITQQQQQSLNNSLKNGYVDKLQAILVSNSKLKNSNTLFNQQQNNCIKIEEVIKSSESSKVEIILEQQNVKKQNQFQQLEQDDFLKMSLEPVSKISRGSSRIQKQTLNNQKNKKQQNNKNGEVIEKMQSQLQDDDFLNNISLKTVSKISNKKAFQSQKQKQTINQDIFGSDQCELRLSTSSKIISKPVSSYKKLTKSALRNTKKQTIDQINEQFQDEQISTNNKNNNKKMFLDMQPPPNINI